VANSQSDWLVPYSLIVQFQKISILPPPPSQKGFDFSEGEEFCKTKNFEELHEGQ